MTIDRIVIAGLGSIGRRHLRLARKLIPNADIRILRQLVTSKVPEYSNGCFSTTEEAVAFAPQIAVIATPATFHISTAQPLAEAGVHLLIEKPLSATLNGVSELIDTCRQQRTVLQIGYNLRFLPSLQRFRDLLGQQVIGKLLSVRCEIGQYLPSWGPGTDYSHGVSARRELGGGVLLELSHEIDYLRWSFGEVDWVRATLSNQSELELDVEDSAHLIIGFSPKDNRNQLIGSLNLDFIRRDTTRLCTAIGENGSLRWNGLTGQVMIYRAGRNEWCELFRHQHQRDDSYQAEWQNFIMCVTSNSTPLITGDDGSKVLEIIEAARISAASGYQVSVQETSQASKDKS